MLHRSAYHLRRRDGKGQEGDKFPLLLPYRVSVTSLSIGLHGRGHLLRGQGGGKCTHAPWQRPGLFTCCLILRLPEWTRGPQQGGQGQVWHPRGQEELTHITTTHCLQGNGPHLRPTGKGWTVLGLAFRAVLSPLLGALPGFAMANSPCQSAPSALYPTPPQAAWQGLLLSLLLSMCPQLLLGHLSHTGSG